jgi:Rieske Fe-S protein
MRRRQFLKRLTLGSIFAAIGISGISEFLNKAFTESQTTLALSTIQVPQASSAQPASVANVNGYIFLTSISNLSGKSSSYFNHPSYGSSLLFLYNGTWKAFSATCTHRPCPVSFTGSTIECPCHAGYFSPVDGGVQGGPPPRPLPQYDVKVVGDNIYVSETTIN